MMNPYCTLLYIRETLDGEQKNRNAVTLRIARSRARNNRYLTALQALH
jgi:hypothetical protein